MGQGLTPSERLVNSLCEKAFLKAWTHPNPIGKKGKELCDCLVVCGAHVIIISVKDIQYNETEDVVGFERWTKKAIQASAEQIWGAERWLQSQTSIKRHDGRIIDLPSASERKYHRISVSLGSNGKVPIAWGDLGFGFVHVCDEKSVEILFQALDTITDLIEFLQATEDLINSDINLIFDGGGIEDLIAIFIQHDNKLDFQTDEGVPSLVVITDDLWSSLSASKEYQNMRNDLKSSYSWDALIESFIYDLLTDGMFEIYSKNVTKDELALVTMALQPRIHRASLADAFLEFLQNEELKIASRVVQGYNNSIFVFLIGKSSDREYRAQELLLRCSIISLKFSGFTIIGIATDRPKTSEIGYSSDIVYMKNPSWTDAEKKGILKIQKELGYFQHI